MASPFSFFRKNQQSMMVVLVILAMLVFTLDSVFSSRENQFVVLGLLLGGTIFAVAGISRGRWMQYGLGGALLGALCGWLLPPWLMSASDRPAVISSSLGAFDDQRIYDLQLQRGLANQFMFRVTEAAYGQGMGQFASSFGFGHQSEREDVVFGELMRSEADDLEIVVTNEMVTAFINQATDNKLTRQAFAKARGEMSVEGKKLTDEMLFDVLRGEIKAQIAFLTLHPQSSVLYQAPEVAYSMFRRLNVSQKMNTAMIDVDAFLDQIPDPSDAEVADFFEKHRLRSPNEMEPGSPGFRQPRKTKLAYLEVDYRKVEDSVNAVTDEEVESFYNENREILYRRPVAPDVPAEPQPSPPAEDSDAKPSPEKSETTEKPEPSPTAPEEPRPEEPRPEEPRPEEPRSEEPRPEEPKPEEPKPEEPKPEESGAGDECGVVIDEVVTDGQVNDAAAAGTSEVSAQVPEASAQVPDSSAAASGDEPKALTIPTEPTADSAAGVVPAEEPMFPEQKFEIRPLDDELKAQIRDQLLSRRVGEVIESRMSEIMKEMQRLETERLSHRLKLKAEFINLDDEKFAARIGEYTPTMIAEAKKLAEKVGAVYVETPFVSVRDLLNTENYPIGSAVPPSGGPTAANGPNVVTTIFSAPGGELQFFRPRRAVLTSFDLDSGETHFGWWIIDDSPSHVPVLDEPGIREEVVLTWKRMKSRELAKKRAEELAAQVREGLAKPDDQKLTMAAALENATATGAEDAARIAVRQTERFTWMRQPFNPQMDFRQQSRPVLGQIAFAGAANETLELAFDRFMQVVFEDLTNDEVGVVANEDLSRYYIVQIIDRTPTPEVGEDALRQRFLTEAGRGLRQSPTFMLMRDNIEMATVSEWEKALWLKYGVDRTLPIDE